MPISLLQAGITVVLVVGSALLQRRRKDDLSPVPGQVVRLSSSPAHFVFGRARRAGLLMYPPVEVEPTDATRNAGSLETSADDGYRDVHLALCLSEGACDGLEAIWLNDVRYDLRIADTESDGSLRYRTDSPVPPYASREGDLFVARACFSADGTQGTAFRDVARIPSGASFGRGKSWVHLHLRQPRNEDDRRERAVGWDSMPEISFLMRGIEIGTSWTDSAASVREYWYKTVLGDTTPFDDDALTAAKTRGDARIMTELAGDYWKYEPVVPGPGSEPGAWGETPLAPTEAEPVVWVSERFREQQRVQGERPQPLEGVWQVPYPWRVRQSDGTIETLLAHTVDDEVDIRYRRAALMHEARRYSVNGVISADISRDDLKDEFDWAMQGDLVHTGDSWVMIAGADWAEALDWDVDAETLLEWGTQPADPDRFSAIDMSLEQSAPADYTKASLPRLVSGEAVKLRSALLVTHPIDGGRLLSTYRRRALEEQRFALAALPEDPRVYNLKRGDVVNLSLARAGLDETRCTVERITIRSDMTVLVEFVLTPLGAYADTITLPPARDKPVATLPPLTPLRVGNPFFVLDQDGLELKLVPQLAGHQSFKWAVATGTLEKPPKTPDIAAIRAGACTTGTDEVVVATFVENEAAIVRVSAVFYRDSECMRGESEVVTQVFTYIPGGADRPIVWWVREVPRGPDPSGKEAFTLFARHATQDVALYWRTFIRGATPGAYTRVPTGDTFQEDPVEQFVEVARPAEDTPDRLIEFYAESEDGSLSVVERIRVDFDTIPSIEADLRIDNATGRTYITVDSLDGDTSSYRGRVAVAATGTDSFPDVEFDADDANEFSGSRTSSGQSGGSLIGHAFRLPVIPLPGQSAYVTLHGFSTRSTDAAKQRTAIRSPAVHKFAIRPEEFAFGNFLIDRDGLTFRLVPRFGSAQSYKYAFKVGTLDSPPTQPSQADVENGACVTSMDPVNLHTFTEGTGGIIAVTVLFYRDATCTTAVGGLQVARDTYDPSQERRLPTVDYQRTTAPADKEAFWLIAEHDTLDVALLHRTFIEGDTPGAYTRVPASGHQSDPLQVRVEVDKPAEGGKNRIIQILAEASDGTRSNSKRIVVDGDSRPSIIADLTIDPATGRGRLIVSSSDGDTGSYRGRVAVDAVGKDSYPTLTYQPNALEFSGTRLAGGESGGARIGESFVLPGAVPKAGQAYYVTLVGARATATSGPAQRGSRRSPELYLSSAAPNDLADPENIAIALAPAIGGAPDLGDFLTRFAFDPVRNTVAIGFNCVAGAEVESWRGTLTYRSSAGVSTTAPRTTNPVDVRTTSPPPLTVPDVDKFRSPATSSMGVSQPEGPLLGRRWTYYCRVPADARDVTLSLVAFTQKNFGGTGRTTSLRVTRFDFQQGLLKYTRVDNEARLADALEADAGLQFTTATDGALRARGVRITRSATPPSNPIEGLEIWDDTS